MYDGGGVFAKIVKKKRQNPFILLGFKTADHYLIHYRTILRKPRKLLFEQSLDYGLVQLSCFFGE